MRIHGSAGVAPIECINPRKNKWRVRWDIEEKDGAASYEEAEFDHRPQMDEVLEVLRNWYNAKTEGLIRTGFVWEKIPVWLSVENQVNYKAAFDLAVQTEGANLPVVFKFGTDEKPVYRPPGLLHGDGVVYPDDARSRLEREGGDRRRQIQCRTRGLNEDAPRGRAKRNPPAC